MASRFSLEGQVAVVTGARGKLGAVWLEALLSAGSSIVAIDMQGVEDPPVVADLLRQYGKERLFKVSCDVRDRSALLMAREKCEEALGVATVLVNNAGIDQPPGKVSTYTLPEYPNHLGVQILETNVLAAFQAMQVFGERMIDVGGGSIINIGSLYGSVSPDSRFYDHVPVSPPFLKPPLYGASKAALHNLTKYFAAHWGNAGIRVNTLSPGGVAGNQDRRFQEKFCERVPLGRMAVNSDLSGPLVFLASDAASYITGLELIVDGGFTVW